MNISFTRRFQTIQSLVGLSHLFKIRVCGTEKEERKSKRRSDSEFWGQDRRSGGPAAVVANVVRTDQWEEGALWRQREGRGHAYTDWLTGCCYVERIVEFGGFWSVLTPLSSPLPSPCPPSTWRCPALPPTPPPPHSLAAKGLLRGVDHVEEAVLVSLLLVDLRDGRGHRHHAVLVDQQEEGLRGVQLQPASVGWGWGGVEVLFLKTSRVL